MQKSRSYGRLFCYLTNVRSYEQLTVPMNYYRPSFRNTIAAINIAIAVVVCSSCHESPTPSTLADTIHSIATIDLGDRPHVDVQVVLDDSVFSIDEEIGLTIKLVNNSDTTQSVLFDRPALSTGGPWTTTAEVKELDVSNSTLRYLSKIVMNSNSYAEKELADSAYSLQPGKFIEGHYHLSDLITFNTPGNKLSPGHYEVQIFYAGNFSNKVIIQIEAEDI